MRNIPDCCCMSTCRTDGVAAAVAVVGAFGVHSSVLFVHVLREGFCLLAYPVAARGMWRVCAKAHPRVCPGACVSVCVPVRACVRACVRQADQGRRGVLHRLCVLVPCQPHRTGGGVSAQAGGGHRPHHRVPWHYAHPPLSPQVLRSTRPGTPLRDALALRCSDTGAGERGQGPRGEGLCARLWGFCFARVSVCL
jgi:hypothetical protein